MATVKVIAKTNNQETKKRGKPGSLDRSLGKGELAAAVLYGLFDGIVLVNMIGEVVYVNNAFEKMLGYKARELVGKPALALPTYQGSKKGTEKATALFQQLVKSGIPDSIDMYALTKAGNKIPLNFTASVINDKDNNPQALVAVVRDITERKQMEQALRRSEHMSRSMLETAGTGIYILQDGRFQYVNRLFEALSGYSFDELKDKHSLDFVHPSDREFVRKKAIQVLKGQSHLPYQFRFMKKDGEIAWVLDRLASLDYGGKRSVLGSLSDISEIKKAEGQILEYTKQLEALFDIGITANGTLDVNNLLNSVLKKVLQVINFDAGGIYIFDRQTNELFLKSHFGVPEKFVHRMERMRVTEGFTARIALSGKPLFVPDINLDERLKRIGISSAGIQSFATIPIITKEKVLGIMAIGSRTPYQFPQSTVHLLGTICNQIGLAIDNAQLYERALQLAYTDGLTGLYNRRYLLEQLEREFARANRNESSLSLIMIDLDGLKDINDRFGHNEGDHILQELGRLTKLNTRASDVAARWGGDEFVVLAPDTVAKSAHRIAERIRAKVELYKPTIRGKQPTITVSVGVATYPEHAGSLTELIKRADEAMYNAKGLGKNQVCVFYRRKGQQDSVHK